MNTRATRTLQVILPGVLLLLVSGKSHAETGNVSSAPALTAQATVPELPAEQLFQQGSRQIRQKQLGAGIQSLQQAAEQGHAAAAFELASYYEMGLGVPRDYQQARHYYQQAAAEPS
ncbi:MAG: hypothetical protein R3E89_06900 [Thiolinea sp.]